MVFELRLDATRAADRPDIKTNDSARIKQTAIPKTRRIDYDCGSALSGLIVSAA